MAVNFSTIISVVFFSEVSVTNVFASSKTVFTTVAKNVLLIVLCNVSTAVSVTLIEGLVLFLLVPQREIRQDRATNKLAQDGVIRDVLGAGGQEPLQELEQALGFDKLTRAKGHLAQQRLHQRFERGQLISQS